jgi:hypothetical protein
MRGQWRIYFSIEVSKGLKFSRYNKSFGFSERDFVEDL